MKFNIEKETIQKREEKKREEKKREHVIMKGCLSKLFKKPATSLTNTAHSQYI